MENKLSPAPELLEQAKTAPSAAALLTLAQERGITLTTEQAAKYYAQLHPEMGAIADEELDNVSGGKSDLKPCPFCHSTVDVYKELWDYYKCYKCTTVFQ